jgi:hypothetical protein
MMARNSISNVFTQSDQCGVGLIRGRFDYPV